MAPPTPVYAIFGEQKVNARQILPGGRQKFPPGSYCGSTHWQCLVFGKNARNAPISRTGAALSPDGVVGLAGDQYLNER
jgi:hypothetical protein